MSDTVSGSAVIVIGAICVCGFLIENALDRVIKELREIKAELKKANGER